MIRISDRVRVSNEKRQTYGCSGIVKKIDGEIANVYLKINPGYCKHIDIRLDNLIKCKSS